MYVCIQIRICFLFKEILFIPSVTAVNVLFVWLAEVSADQTVDNFIISPTLPAMGKSECGAWARQTGAGSSQLSLGQCSQSPDLPAPASPSQGAAPSHLPSWSWTVASPVRQSGPGIRNCENYLKYPFIENGEFKTWGNALNILMVTFVKGINSIL